MPCCSIVPFGTDPFVVIHYQSQLSLPPFIAIGALIEMMRSIWFAGISCHYISYVDSRALNNDVSGMYIGLRVHVA